jgi:cyclic-di-GMP phosphodiesterase TipF (flagellum assembly factor)
MSNTANLPGNSAEPSAWIGQAVVHAAIMLVATAAGVALYVHTDAPGPVAAVGGLSVLVALLAVHMSLNRSNAPAAAPKPARREQPRVSPALAERLAQTPAAKAPPPPITRSTVPSDSSQSTLLPPQQLPNSPAGAVDPAERPDVAALIAKMATQMRPSSQPPQPPRLNEAEIARSIAELRARTAERDAPEAPAVTVPPPAPVAAPVAPATAPRSQSLAKLAEIAEALEAERLELALAPILGLRDRSAQHYEVIVRLATHSSTTSVPHGFDGFVRGTALMPLLEALKVSRTTRLAERLDAAGEPGALLSSITGDAIISDRVVSALFSNAEASPRAAARIVLSFVQGDVRAFGAGQWATLNELAGLGIRFALEQVVDLDMDFEQLAASGFIFIKLDAPVFLEGLPAEHGYVPAADLCHYLGSLGLTVIVARIDDARDLARITSLGVPFGQGALFGITEPIVFGPQRQLAA